MWRGIPLLVSCMGMSLHLEGVSLVVMERGPSLLAMARAPCQSQNRECQTNLRSAGRPLLYVSTMLFEECACGSKVVTDAQITYLASTACFRCRLRLPASTAVSCRWVPLPGFPARGLVCVSPSGFCFRLPFPAPSPSSAFGLCFRLMLWLSVFCFQPRLAASASVVFCVYVSSNGMNRNIAT
jgi:hypothetical protein